MNGPPHEEMAESRSKCPVQWTDAMEDFPEEGGFWSLLKAEHIREASLNWEAFSSETGGVILVDSVLPPEIQSGMFIAMDPPRHTEQRRTVAPAFGPSQVAAMKADVQQRTAEVLDSLPIGTPFDWVEKVSVELPTGMLARMFDFPWEERHKLTYWSDLGGDVELVREPGGLALRNAAMNEMGQAFAQLWQEKAANPGQDLISVMMQSDAMKEMSPEEFIGNLILLIVGGNDTTRNSMSAIAYGLHKFPEERAKLEADPSLIPNAVQELIRWQTPLSHTRRTVVEDTVFEGVQMNKGDKVVLWYISANHDETVFDDPYALKIDRANARRHLAFGCGIHRCVGARIAEVQLHTLLEEMSKRRLRVNVIEEPERVPACWVHGYSKMMVTLEHY